MSHQDDERLLTVLYAAGAEQEPRVQARVEESTDSITVTLTMTTHAHEAGVLRHTGYLPRAVELRLERPVGDRCVADGADGRGRPKLDPRRPRTEAAEIFARWLALIEPRA